MDGKITQKSGLKSSTEEIPGSIANEVANITTSEGIDKVSSVSHGVANGVAALFGRRNIIKSESVIPDVQKATLTRKPTEK